MVLSVEARSRERYIGTGVIEERRGRFARQESSVNGLIQECDDRTNTSNMMLVQQRKQVEIDWW